MQVQLPPDLIAVSNVNAIELPLQLSKTDFIRTFGPEATVVESFGISFTPEVRDLMNQNSSLARGREIENWITAATDGVYLESNRSSYSNKSRKVTDLLRGLSQEAQNLFLIRAAQAVASEPGKDISGSMEVFQCLVENADISKVTIEPAHLNAVLVALCKNISTSPESFNSGNFRQLDFLLKRATEFSEEKKKYLRAFTEIFSGHSNFSSPEVAFFAIDIVLQRVKATGDLSVSRQLLDKPGVLESDEGECQLAELIAVHINFCAENQKSAGLDSFSSVTSKAKGDAEEHGGALAKLLARLEKSGKLPGADVLSENTRHYVVQTALSRPDPELAERLAQKYAVDLKIAAQSAITQAFARFDLYTVATVSRANNINRDTQESRKLLSELDAQFEQAKSGNDLPEAAQLLKKAESLRHFLDHGETIKSIATVMNIPQGYNGKVMLFHVEDKVVVRGFSNSSDQFHGDIVRDFKVEMDLRGLSKLNNGPIGGAHLSQKEAGSKICLRGKSEDFGECNKQLMKVALQTAFPTVEIEISS